MAITTLAGVNSGARPPVMFHKAMGSGGAAGRAFSLFYAPGYPGAAAAPTPGLAGAALTSYAGQLGWDNPASGNSYLSRLQASANNAGTLLLCDRLWHNSGLSLTTITAQTINSAAWPARDSNAAVSGEDVLIGLEITTSTGAGTPVLSMTYTNSAGAGSKVGAGILSTAATSAVGSFFPMGLAAGDTGVQSIQDFTFSATWTSGAASLVAYRIIAALEIPSTFNTSAIEAVSASFPQMFDDTVPFLIYLPNASTTPVVNGQLIYTQG